MYEVSYSQRVTNELSAMIARNPTRASEIIAAFRKIDYQLRIYPQFGDPLWDLSVANAKFCIATVDPLVVWYVLIEPEDANQRQVMVVRPFAPLPWSGIV